MKEEMKKIVNNYGKEILLEKKKFLSIFTDIAPKLKKEKKLLELALDENIAELFVNCPINDRKANIVKARRKLENYMAKSGIDDVLNSFAYALDWNDEFSDIEKNDVRPKQQQNEKVVVEDKKDKMSFSWLLKTILLATILGIAITIIDYREILALNIINFLVMFFTVFIAGCITKYCKKGFVLGFIVWFILLGIIFFLDETFGIWNYFLNNG